MRYWRWKAGKGPINRRRKDKRREVETHILAHPKVENCAYVRDARSVLGRKRLCLYSDKRNQEMTLEELCKFLKEERHITIFKLPER